MEIECNLSISGTMKCLTQSHIVLMTTEYLFAEKITAVYNAHFAGDHFMKEVFDVFGDIV